MTTTGVLLGCAGAALAAGVAAGARWPRVWLGLTLAGAAAGVAAALGILGGVDGWEWEGPVLGGQVAQLRLDGLSAVFVTLVGVIGGAGAIYGWEYWSARAHPHSAGRGRTWWSALLLSMGLVLVAANGLHFLLGWELFTVSAFFLITLERERRPVRAAGWLYLGASHAGTLCLFGFFALLAARTGSWELGPWRDRPELAPLFWLALAGFGVKAGWFPLHVWLPSAHANAPSHVSAILSGVALKLGVYGILRFGGWLPVPAAAGWVVLGVGAASAVLGIAFALGQNDLKRLLAYCSVENIGVILIGVGAALLAVGQGDAGWGRWALAGALWHVWNHGMFKSLLFFGAGAVLHATGTREMSRLGGLARVMPWTASLFALGALAVAGLPPLNGFVSEWLIYLGLFGAAAEKGPAAGVVLPAALALGVAGALALATFVKAGAVVFLGAPRTQAARVAQEAGPLMRHTMLALAAGCLGLGLLPTLVWPAVARAVAVWNPAWAPGPAAVPLAALGTVQATLAVLGVLAVAALGRKVRANGARRGPTWDCGYAAPGARMQYTSGSFGALAAGWFRWVLQPERRLRPPRGAWPRAAWRHERVPETVLERVVAPAAAAVLRVSTAVRQLQHGRLQSYIVYLVAGLAAIGGLVWWGSAS